MTQHEAHQLQLLEQLDDILQKLDPTHLHYAHRRFDRAWNVRRKQAREQAKAEARQISRKYGIPLREIAQEIQR